MDVVNKPSKIAYTDGVVSLETALKRVRYIPKYQRNYDWATPQCDSLLKDLLRFSRNPNKDGNSKYIFGQIVCYNSDDNHLFILDGQQRLTTSTIMVASIRNIFRKIQRQVKYEMDEKILEMKMVLINDEKPLLNVYKDNQRIMDVIIKDHDQARNMGIQKLTPSQNNMVTNYNFFFDSFCKIIDIEKDEYGEYSDDSFDVSRETYMKLVEFYKDFVNFKVCEIFSSHLSEAYEMFEAINNRGIPLKPLDLLKNHIYSKCYVDDKSLNDDDSEIESKWKIISDKLDALKKRDKDNSEKYLRYFVNATEDFVRGNNLYEVLIRSIKTNKDAIDFINNFTKALEFFKLAYDPSYKTSEITDSTKRILIGLSGNSFDSYSPMALSVYLKNTNTGYLDKKLHAILSAYDRFYVLNIIPGISRTSKIEELTSRLAISYYHNQIDIQEVIDRIDNNIEYGEKVVDQLTSMKWSNNVSRYVLSEIYNRSSGSDVIDLVQVNVEHILPKSNKRLEKNWPNITVEEHSRCFSKLGNLILLNGKTNKSIQDSGFEKKKKWYQQDDQGHMFKRYSDVNDSLIIEKTVWGEVEIGDRTNYLVERVIDLWSKPEYEELN